jgi:hypothetical protein
VVGLILGIVLTLVAKPYLLPLMPEALKGKAKATDGRVVAKRLQGDRLLLTVDASDGAVLATFTQKVPEIDLLVDDGDLVTLGLPGYEPFAENPPILAVRKKHIDETAPSEAPAAAAASEAGAGAAASPASEGAESGMGEQAQPEAPPPATGEGAQQEGAPPPSL